MKVLTFGEILLRLASPGHTRLFQRDSLECSFCGGEANVAVSLSILGLDSAFVTKVPNNAVGEAALNSMRYFGVDTSKVLKGTGRMGLYYLEKGASQRPSKVIYDREFSAIAMAKKDEFDWNRIFEGVTWFHWTGINPALSSELAGICLEACKVAKSKGITISCDLNYRKKLWSSEKAQLVMKNLVQYVDVCIANEEDADKILGIKANDTDVENGKINVEGYEGVAKEVSNQYGCKYVAITLRESYSASKNGWRALLYQAETGHSFVSQKYDIDIVDRVGGGDSFAAGIIYSLITKKTCQDAIEFAVASSCLKHTIEGDFNRSTEEEIHELLKSGGSGRVQR